MTIGMELVHDLRGTGTVVEFGENFICMFFEEEKRRGRFFSDSDCLSYLDGERVWPAPVAPKIERLTKRQKARRYADDLAKIPLVWAVAGFLASHDSRFTASAPEHLQSNVSDMLDSYGIPHDIGITLTGNPNQTLEDGRVYGAQGPSFCVVFEDFGIADKFEEITGIKATQYQNSKQRSIQVWQFILVLLLGDLGFKLSAKNQHNAVQDLYSIRSRVPGQFRDVFDGGTNGVFPNGVFPI